MKKSVLLFMCIGIIIMVTAGCDPLGTPEVLTPADDGYYLVGTWYDERALEILSSGFDGGDYGDQFIFAKDKTFAINAVGETIEKGWAGTWEYTKGEIFEIYEYGTITLHITYVNNALLPGGKIPSGPTNHECVKASDNEFGFKLSEEDYEFMFYTRQ